MSFRSNDRTNPSQYGDAVTLQYALSIGHTVDFTGTNTLGSGVRGKVLNITDPSTGKRRRAANMPGKQIDFVAGLQKMFNLVFIPEETTPKLYVDRSHLHKLRNVEDWTNLIDLSNS